MLVTSSTYSSEFSYMERNLKDNIKEAETVLSDFREYMDGGELTHRALESLLVQNVQEARNALVSFTKLGLLF